MNPLRIPLQVVFYQEEGLWVAHSLQFDLVGVAETKDDALGLLNEAIGIQIRNSIASGNPRNLFTPADSEYFQRFAEGSDVVEGELRISIEPRPAPGIVFERMDVREFHCSPGPWRNCDDLVTA